MSEDLVGQQLGQYELRELVRYGGMATVYKAYQPSLDRWVAVKVLDRPEDATFVARFEAEARAIARFQHPNIVPVYDYGEQDGHLYLVVSFVEDGRTLGDLIGQPMPPTRALELGVHILSGLGYAHAHGVVHRDIKPSNVLLPRQDWPMLADFGIAKLLIGERQDLTQQGMIVGTAAYMAPEQAFGLAVDARTDLYALGTVLYELITGRVPFESDQPMVVLMKQAYEPPESPRAINPELPEKVETLVMKALAKEPDARYENAEVMTEAIAATLAELPDRPRRSEMVADPVLAAYKTGVAAYSAGRWQDSIDQLERVASVDPDYEDVEALLESARALLDGERGSGSTSAPTRPPTPPQQPVVGVFQPPTPAPAPAPPAPTPPVYRQPAAPTPAAQPPPATPAGPPPAAAARPAPPAPADRTTDPVTPAHPARPAPPAQTPTPPQGPAAAPQVERPRRRGRWALGSVLGLLVLGGAVYLGMTLGSGDGGGGGGGNPTDTTAAPATTVAPPAQEWKGITEAPVGLEASGTAVFKNRIWVAGGFDSARKARTTVLIYDPAKDTWSEGPDLPEAITHATLVSTGRDLFVIGGYRGETTTPIVTVRRLDNETLTWVDTPRARDLPVAVGAGAAAWDGRRIVFGGGVTANGKPSGRVFALEGTSWREIGALSEPREHLAAVSDGKGTVFFLAGEVTVGNRKDVFATVDAVKGSDVSKLGEIPTPRGSVGGFWTAATGACAVGGRSPDGGLHSEVECLAADGTPKVLPRIGTPRHGLDAAAVGGNAYALLGAEIGATTFTTAEVLSLKS
jgi:serine/threonine protein kinase